MSDATCSVDGCESRPNCRGWCNAHYLRWLRYGDPLGVARRPSPSERFWAKVDKTGSSGCWLWTASTDPGGYGVFRASGRGVKAHRWAYEQLVGPIPDGLVLDHLCRVRRCVNPEHLEPVTQRENVLRGEGLAAQAAARTHCPKGHELTAANTYTPPGSRKRYCRACRLDRRPK